MLDKHFGTPVFCKLHTRFESQSVQTEIGNIVEKLNFAKVPQWGSSNHSLSDPTFKTSLFDQFDMPLTVNLINKNVTDYLNSLGYDKTYNLVIKESWLTDTRKNEYTVLHNHGAFDISGVYYFSTNGKDGDIHFVNPTQITDTSKFINDTQYVRYVPEVGKLILFPGWLMHFVDENETDSRRMSLSFNIQIEEE
jgi:uncharacterized protein (TIGR02466 family)